MKYILVSIMVTLMSCSPKESITKIEVTYLRGLRLPITAVSCFYDSASRRVGLIDTSITDKSILDKINNEIYKLKSLDADDYIDARKTCFVYFQGGKVDTICLETFCHKTIYNGKLVSKNHELIYLIKKSIGIINLFPQKHCHIFRNLKSIKDIESLLMTRVI